jgi:hypothetical protein
VSRRKIAVFVCSNGLGHLRRVVAISAFILKNEYQGIIDLYASFDQIKLLKNWSEMSYILNSKSVNFFDFVYPSLPQNKVIDSYSTKDWLRFKVPDLSSYDIVWSDNIVSILESRPDTILTGSFFWHEVLSAYSNDSSFLSFLKEQESIVKTVIPLMAGNQYFSTPGVQNDTNFFPVGLYRYSIVLKEKKMNAILISCGLGGEEEDEVRVAIDRIIKENIIPPEILYVEPRLLPEKYPKWILKADYSNEMFLNCNAVCIRPGMGTISDSLIARCRIFAFSNTTSFEMDHNCFILEKMSIGERCYNPFDAYLKALNYVKQSSKIESQIFRTSHLRTDGVFATAELLVNR